MYELFIAWADFLLTVFLAAAAYIIIGLIKGDWKFIKADKNKEEG